MIITDRQKVVWISDVFKSRVYLEVQLSESWCGLQLSRCLLDSDNSGIE